MYMPGYISEGYKEIMKHNVIEQTYWNLKLDSMTQDGKDTVDSTGFRAAIDSGTSLIMGPQDLVDKVVEGITVNQDCSGVDELPDITFTIDGHPYPLKAADYVV